MIGDIDAVGSEQHGDRPVLVIQCDELNGRSPTVLIAFITSQLGKKAVRSHVHLSGVKGLRKRSMVLTEKVREVDKKRLLGYVGKLDDKTMSRVDRAVRYSFGLGRRRKDGRHDD